MGGTVFLAVARNVLRIISKATFVAKVVLFPLAILLLDHDNNR